MPPSRPARHRQAPSVLRMSALGRLALVLPPLMLMWFCVALALGWFA